MVPLLRILLQRANMRHLCVRRFATGLIGGASRTNAVDGAALAPATEGSTVRMELARSLAWIVALALAVLLSAESAEARLEDNVIVGEAAQRTAVSRPAGLLVAAAGTDHPATGLQSGSLGGLFNRPGMVGSFAGGFLGSGLLGLTFGYGVFGGLGAAPSYLGLLFQLALIAMLGRLIWTWWTGRHVPTFAGLSPRQLADPYLRTRNDLPPGMGAPADAEEPDETGKDKAAAHCDREG
jgi:hypothetical protein